jgi:coatomer subunit beta
MATSGLDKNCTFLISTEKANSIQQEDICKDLESPEIENKVQALKNAITGLLGGETMPRVLMTVIRFCITCEDHQVKKLLMLYWELVPKYSTEGKLLPEMILVCNALRNDLISPNEFIRGCMLRFLCKLKEPELLEPLVPSIKTALEHRHSYVRRNAALAVYSVHKSFGDQLLPDGPELMEKFILNETDISARRNAFLMLFNEAEAIAIDFLAENIEDIKKFGDGFALLVLELTRKTCRRDPAQKSRFVRCLFQLLRSDSPAVSYEAAWTLVSLSTAPTAVRACAQTYSQLLTTSSDNNVKLIVLDRLVELKKHHSKVVQEILMDILRALSSPNIDICKKTLALAIDLVGPRNIEEVMQVLKREVVRAQESDLEHGDEYKTLLIQAIHRCATKYAEVADSIVVVLLDFLAGDGGYDVLQCVKSIVEQYPNFRPTIIRKIIDNLDEITSAEALRVGLWILGEYSDVLDPSTNESMLGDAYEAIKGLLGEPPFLLSKDMEITEKKGEEPTTITTTKNVVLKDGTYATVTSTETTGGMVTDDSLTHLRRLVSAGDILLGTVACVCLTKLCLKATAEQNKLVLGTVLTIAGVGKLAEQKRGDRVGVHADCLDRLALCSRVLLDPALKEKLMGTFLKSCKDAFGSFVSKQKAVKIDAAEKIKKGRASQADDLIQFRQLRAQAVQGGIEVDLMDADDISRAVGEGGADGDGSKLRHVYQLTGYSDPVYAEASVTVHDYDIVLEILVINRTPNTLTNLTVELATMGDLKLVERPQSHTIGPLDERKLRANIKVSSTETSHIFGTIVFDNSSTAQKTYVNMNDIQLDIMDYIRPAECKGDGEGFRSMWAEFEWENKVAINTHITDLYEFITHIINNTNMTCLSPLENDNEGDKKGTSFLAANLYARSVFGEDALVNVSVEKKDDVDGKLNGYIRIRSKTQGIALSLGDRITSIQRIAGSEPAAP